MKTLKQQIAELLVDAYDKDDKLPPPEWKLVADYSDPEGRGSSLHMYTPMLESEDFYIKAKAKDYKRLETITLPKGYEVVDYEEVLEEMFPNAQVKEGIHEQRKQVPRRMKRRFFEDSLHLASL